MQIRNYRICDEHNKVFNFLTKEDVKKHLNEISNGDHQKISRIEIFDPVTGWDYATKWINLKAQRES